MNDILFAKAYGCLAALALGDALGLPTEMLTPSLIAEWYGEIRGLTTIDTRHPHHNLPRGSVSDDTDQVLLLAQLLIENGAIDSHRFAQQLLAWSRTPRVRDNNFLGKATRAALDAIASGVPVESTGRGETIGAAMRVAPVGLAIASREKLIEQVVASCLPTHNTHAAISGAMAVTFAVSAALKADATIETMADAAAEGARVGGEFGAWSWAPPLDKRIAWAMHAATGMPARDAARFAYEVIGTGEAPWELITSAFAILRAADGEPMPALLAAANTGGDTDTLGAIVGALAGALSGIKALDAAMVKQVEQVNGLELAVVARGLLKCRT